MSDCNVFHIFLPLNMTLRCLDASRCMPGIEAMAISPRWCPSYLKWMTEVKWPFSCCIFRYISKHRPAVVLEYKSTKDTMRTMGPAKVEVPLPDKYLKKHSKEPKLPESEFSCRVFDQRMGAILRLSFTFMFTVRPFRDTGFKRGS